MGELICLHKSVESGCGDLFPISRQCVQMLGVEPDLQSASRFILKVIDVVGGRAQCRPGKSLRYRPCFVYDSFFKCQSKTGLS